MLEVTPDTKPISVLVVAEVETTELPFVISARSGVKADRVKVPDVLTFPELAIVKFPDPMSTAAPAPDCVIDKASPDPL